MTTVFARNPVITLKRDYVAHPEDVIHQGVRSPSPAPLVELKAGQKYESCRERTGRLGPYTAGWPIYIVLINGSEYKIPDHVCDVSYVTEDHAN